MPEEEIRERGGATKWRRKILPSGKYINVAVVPKAGPHGGHTIAGPAHREQRHYASDVSPFGMEHQLAGALHSLHLGNPIGEGMDVGAAISHYGHAKTPAQRAHYAWIVAEGFGAEAADESLPNDVRQEAENLRRRWESLAGQAEYEAEDAGKNEPHSGVPGHYSEFGNPVGLHGENEFGRWVKVRADSGAEAVARVAGATEYANKVDGMYLVWVPKEEGANPPDFREEMQEALSDMGNPIGEKPIDELRAEGYVVPLTPMRGMPPGPGGVYMRPQGMIFQDAPATVHPYPEGSEVTFVGGNPVGEHSEPTMAEHLGREPGPESARSIHDEHPNLERDYTAHGVYIDPEREAFERLHRESHMGNPIGREISNVLHKPPKGNPADGLAEAEQEMEVAAQLTQEAAEEIDEPTEVEAETMETIAEIAEETQEAAEAIAEEAEEIQEAASEEGEPEIAEAMETVQEMAEDSAQEAASVEGEAEQKAEQAEDDPDPISPHWWWREIGSLVKR